jgi:hypothetical protein
MESRRVQVMTLRKRDPSEREIEERKRAIRAGWTRAERTSRSVDKGPAGWTVPEVVVRRLKKGVEESQFDYTTGEY